MKRVPIRTETQSSSPQVARPLTRLKNTYEAYRAGVASGVRSSEYKFASCACCAQTYPVIKDANESVVWDQLQYSFLEQGYDISDESEHLRVHPALWENGANNAFSGVFEVLEGKIYQVRGFDMANITFVKTNNIQKNKFAADDRWMVMDTLMSTECTEAALEAFEAYIQSLCAGYVLKGNIVGMIVSHSHVDHYGGMTAVKSWFTSDVTEGKEDAPAIPFILVPEGFTEHSVSENVYVGNAMGRRASYQYGSFIKPTYVDSNTSEDDYLSGEISIGIGQGQSTGTISFEIPTMEISENCKLTLDTLETDFQLTPGTEAPAEMNNYFPAYRALWLAENCNGTLHNLYTLRGAQVRDGKAWAGYLMETVALYGEDVRVIFQSHNWPHWKHGFFIGSERFPDPDAERPECDLSSFLIETAAVYKYINDQTLLYMNMGYKMNEAADMLTLPRKMQENWCLKPFYGTPKHNAKAVYQRYLGWYDANPLHLEELPPEQLAKEQVRYILAGGSVDKLFELIQTDIAHGNYWIAGYMAHQIVLGSSDTDEILQAKLLCAEALEQLGYQCESGTWRNAYLSAAYELRNGKFISYAQSGSMLKSMSAEMLLDYLSIMFDGELGASTISFDGYLDVSDSSADVNSHTYFRFAVKNGAVLYSEINAGDFSNLNSTKDCVEITKDDLICGLAGTLADTASVPKVFRSIFACCVTLKSNRFSSFEIMSRNDSDFYSATKGASVDLRDIAMQAITFLEANQTAEDSSEWGELYTILKTESRVILGDDFFTPGTDGRICAGAFKDYERYYVLCSLYHYLNHHYIKNDVGYYGTDIKLVAMLKRKISFLETFVSDFYTGDIDTKIIPNEDEVATWGYLAANEPTTDAWLPEGIKVFFQTLYKLHKELHEKLKSTSN